MAPPYTKLPHQRHQFRTFIDARIKWVRDPYLDFAVHREKDLQQAVFLKNHILSTPSKSLPLSTASLLKAHLHLPTSTYKFSLKYPSIFTQFHPRPNLPPQLKLTQQALALHKEESAIHSSPIHRKEAVRRLSKLLMLTRACKLPIYIVDRLIWDMGLPHNYVLTLLADFPEYFQVCEIKDELSGEQVLALELVSWRDELAVSEVERRVLNCGNSGSKKGRRIAFPMCLPKGFELEKKVWNWVEEWQELPYISPYEDAFHLSPSSAQAEKWAVAVLHELFWLLVSKKMERDLAFCVGEYLGFGARFKKALSHYPGIFYVSNKIRTQTVVLREAYRKDFLVEKHPLMGMRYRYIHLMNKVPKWRKQAVVMATGG
ncbi:hypothetical protein F2P56_028698 [Juglans regia]|uniref:Protein WHAT'S THIS FACTOR 9, mitochondrial n=2 Tax=Juglans regia TaxID=51240 RepID=A0A2I4EEV1_JUGRE|nr:protein WHAT'S THIS FACTOR 9, mitochondrial [Juglans regia]KAF5448140.1 hypothetical protein F2P56_028698 [Juglans regia]